MVIYVFMEIEFYPSYIPKLIDIPKEGTVSLIFSFVLVCCF